MIDLHLHTTASDGLCTPEELVAQAAARGIHTLSVTDHDTMAGMPAAAAAAAIAGLRFVPGIEITAVWKAKDVHMLGYFLDHRSPELTAFLTAAREDRLLRARRMGARLAELGVPIDMRRLLPSEGLHSDRAIARPMVARALVECGYVKDIAEAFDRYLAEDRPAYFPRRGASPMEVVQVIARAGGVASLAHPGPLGRDELIPELVEAGLGAIEAYHSEHSPETTARYLEIARTHGLLVTGGSDYHGEGMHRAESFGALTLPEEAFDSLARLAGSLVM